MLLLLLSAACQAAPDPSTVPYVFTTFDAGEVLGEGMRLHYSVDGRNWRQLMPSLVLRSKGTLFRDPSIVWREGWFHLVYTTELLTGCSQPSWERASGNCTAAFGPRFGYARSKDLLKWEGHKFVELSSSLPNACNVWAPEVFWDDDGQQFLVVFSSTISRTLSLSACPPDLGGTYGNHRAYYVTTTDFVNFTAASKLFDLGESAIDHFIFKQAGKYFLVYKGEQNSCLVNNSAYWPSSCSLYLKLAVSKSATGPYLPASVQSMFGLEGGISHPCVEGPSVIRVNNSWMVYFDGYRNDCQVRHKFCSSPSSNASMTLLQNHKDGSCTHITHDGFGALMTDDLVSFQDVSDQIQMAPGNSHGTALHLPWEALQSMCKAALWSKSKIGCEILQDVGLSEEDAKLTQMEKELQKEERQLEIDTMDLAAMQVATSASTLHTELNKVMATDNLPSNLTQLQMSVQQLHDTSSKIEQATKMLQAMSASNLQHA